MTEEDASTAGFKFLLQNYFAHLSLSGLLLGAIAVTALTTYYYGQVGVASCIIIWFLFSTLWKRKMNRFQDIVRVETIRKLRMEKVQIIRLPVVAFVG